MRTVYSFMIVLFAFCLAVPSAELAAKGYMGGGGTVVVEEDPPADTGDDGGIPDTVEGPLNDMMSDAGKLYGDLYVILRQQGVLGDKKLVPAVDADGEPVTDQIDNIFTYIIDDVTYTYTVDVQSFTEYVNTDTTPDAVVGGEPVLTVIDSVDVNGFADYGWYAAEIGLVNEVPVYGAAQSPYPAQCVQPVASYNKWGDISSKSGLTKNRLPMVITYDATWNRSECAVGKLVGDVTADSDTGELEMTVDPYFIEPCFVVNADGTETEVEGADCTWPSWIFDETSQEPVLATASYPYGVLWTDLIGEVHFGRLNLSRAPEAVLQAAFDEAINNINNPDTGAIEIDAAGRLLLTKNVYDELLVDPLTGYPLFIGTTKKAIDSPLENVALYVKLMQDGHLVTPGDERMPIDRSKDGGIPIWKMLELTDGPGAKGLRPTISIAKMRNWGMGHLVDVNEVDYLTYYICLNDAGTEVPCLIWDYDPVEPELDEKLIANPAVVGRELVTVEADLNDIPPEGDYGCPDSPYIDPDSLYYDGVNPYVCEGPFTGIMTDDGGAPDAADLNFAASHIAAAADKTGHMTVDMIVYLNSILGINQVLGYSEYDADGEPTADAIDYEKKPVYFNYRDVAGYSRESTFGARGQVVIPGGSDSASTYDGKVKVLQGETPTWTETEVEIFSAEMDGVTIFDNIELDLATGFPSDPPDPATENIFGFTQLADDDLSVIRFIHTFQIPGLR